VVRVVVTGLGVCSSIGMGIEAFAEGLRLGRSAARPITAFDTTGFDHSQGCEIAGFDPRDWLRRADPEDLGRASQFSAAAARMAVRDAGLDDLPERRSLVAIGTTDGESVDLDRLVAGELADGAAAMSPRIARRATAGNLSAAVCRELGLTDVEATTFATACSAGNYAIGCGLDALRLGDVDVALCGGADAFCRKTFTAFYRLGSIARDYCRPFDTHRQGILTGEGAGVLVLETLESAVRRGARIYAEVLGYGLSCDAHHAVAPHQAGVARSMTLALRDAGVRPDDVDLISAHGTGTKLNDVTEVRAIRQVYGDSPPPVTALKSMLGHTMGASSALGAIGCVVAITRGFIPPTINHRNTDPECDIDCVPNVAVDKDIRIVQNNGLAFGGNNASVVLGRLDRAA
jgi:3-oxoacyl-[acyl-carrier-protein] synthase II